MKKFSRPLRYLVLVTCAGRRRIRRTTVVLVRTSRTLLDAVDASMLSHTGLAGLQSFFSSTVRPEVTMKLLLSSVATLSLFVTPSRAFFAIPGAQANGLAKRATAPTAMEAKKSMPAGGEAASAKNEDYWWEEPFGNSASSVGEVRPSGSSRSPPARGGNTSRSPRSDNSANKKQQPAASDGPWWDGAHSGQVPSVYPPQW